MFPLASLLIVDTHPIVSAHHHVAIGHLCHAVHTVVEQGLVGAPGMTEDGGGAAYRACHVDSARITAHDDAAPAVDDNSIDAIAVEHTL